MSLLCPQQRAGQEEAGHGGGGCVAASWLWWRAPWPCAGPLPTLSSAVVRWASLVVHLHLLSCETSKPSSEETDTPPRSCLRLLLHFLPLQQRPGSQTPKRRCSASGLNASPCKASPGRWQKAPPAASAQPAPFWHSPSLKPAGTEQSNGNVVLLEGGQEVGFV